ncbi:DUF6624 domain-containing protein [Pinibacter soli]|uniref:Uncharacterized protein n=1 Tax=Pinibacter soli TaxID=3044211 RepID=A0ABT6RGK1_9BACT|nr:DUF6624 domain-containing protein [Pinibacter soli]MDI3320999.1 hypothetical protein [Pinibacter soli]
MRSLLFILSLYIGQFCHAQQLLVPPAEYNINLAIADSLSEIKEYTKATYHLNAAFESFQWRGTPKDRFKAARIFALANNCDSSFKNIERLWKQDYVNYLKITSDTAFNILRRTDQPRFDTLMQHIKNTKERTAPNQNLEWTNYLDSIFLEDQAIRRKWQKAAKTYGYNSQEALRYWPEMQLKDSMNLIAITSFIDTYGWQSEETVGSTGNSTLFLVIQHADSTNWEKYLPLLKKAVSQKKAKPQDLALLTDRLSLAKHGYQIYGSQVHQDATTKKMVFDPIKNEKNVDKRRKKMNLQPLSEYGKYFGIDYKPKV